MSPESRTQSSHDRVTTDQSSEETVSPGVEPRVVAGGALLLAGVGLAAANMRPAVTSLASVLGEVRDALGVGSGWASAITSVPTACFGVAGIAAPVLSRRWGLNRVIGGALAVLTVAMVLRVVGGAWNVLAGTVVVCASIAMCNVLIPVVVKQWFPTRAGIATALYTTTMAAGGALGSSVTPWMRSTTGSWRLALLTWAVLALAALCVWVPGSRGLGRPEGDGMRARGSSNSSLFRSPLAWMITFYFAMQSLIAYVVMGWLPEVYKGAGMDATSAGAVLGVLLVIGVPTNLVLPLLVSRTRQQSGWALGLASLVVAGLLGLLIAPLSAPLLWAVLIGLGMAAFPLALIIIQLRTVNAAQTSELSAMAQSIGYLIASVGPLLFGLLHDMTGGWSVSLTVMVVVVVAQSLIGVVVGRPRTV